MISIKTEQDIKHLRHAGKILARVLREVIKEVKPGVTTRELDALAEKLIIENGAQSAFKNYTESPNTPKFPSTLCTSVNNEVVHAPASGRTLQLGDIIGVDVGLKYFADKKWYYVDMAQTVGVGRVSAQAQELMKVTKRALDIGIEQVRPGGAIGDIGRAVQEYVEGKGFSVVRQLVGHGVGFAVHEEPRVPNYVDFHEPDITMKPGMVLAIEPMVNVGKYEIKSLADGWTIVTADGSLSAHFEHTIAVTEKGREILTQ